MKKTGSILLLFIASSISSVLAMPMTFIKMESTGDYVVTKGSYYYDNNNSIIQASNSYSSTVQTYQNSPSFWIKYDPSFYYGFPNYKYWSINFSTHEIGGPMQIGTYNNAVRFPFEPANTPGMSISGNGRGNNTLTGSFEVFDIAYQDNTLLRFAANFEQNNRIFGSISYNSDYFNQSSTPTSPVGVPAPPILLLLGLVFAGVIVNKQKYSL